MREILSKNKKPRLSMRSAINRKCKECIYDPIGGNGTWRQQVEGCTSYSCPLFDLRPRPRIGEKIEAESD